MAYVFLQCNDETCRLRFPAAAAEVAGLACPRCQGPLAVAAVVERAPLTAPSAWSQPPLIALLDNIRSIHNVGSMFRTADGAGLPHLHLAGITATPDHPKLAKAALGRAADRRLDVSRQRRRGRRTITDGRLPALGAGAADDRRPAGPGHALFRWPARWRWSSATSGPGVDPGILALRDVVLSLPMVGQKSS